MGDKTNSDLLRRPLYVYAIPAEVLATLSLKPDASIPDQAPPSPPLEDRADSDLVGSQACSLCSLTFTTVLDQRSHQKSDWHHYNLKQKLRSEKLVTEIEFEKLVGELDESLSGSDPSESDDEEDNAGRKESTLTALLKKQANLADRRSSSAPAGNDEEDTLGRKGKGKAPLIWFSSPELPQNTYFGIYRAILTGEELQDETKLVDVIKKKQLEPIAIPRVPKDGSVPLPAAAYKGPHFFLCMIGGGHFAAMVVSLAPRQNKSSGTLNREAVVLAHKTFHRYTTRRKQGGSQSANDNAKGAAHSAGSSLRRYNEQALVEDVRELLREWKELLDTSELLFIRATGATNRRTLFGPYEGQVLKHSDLRIRGFPFNTRRATQNELMRSFIELTRLKVREINPEEPKLQTEIQTPAPTKTPNAKPAKPKLTEEEETALLHTSQIQALIRRTKLPALLSYLKQNNLTPDFQFQPPEQNHHSPTPLHLAANQNAAPLALGLITRGGASPVVVNKDGKTAFDLAGDRATRDAFRVARSELGEDKWDWEAAHVPAPLSKDDAEKRDQHEKKEREGKEAERRRAEEERLRREGPQVDDRRKKAGLASVAPLKSAQEKREEEARGLTPEMRMKLDRERRARAAEERLKRMQAGG